MGKVLQGLEGEIPHTSDRSLQSSWISSPREPALAALSAFVRHLKTSLGFPALAWTVVLALLSVDIIWAGAAGIRFIEWSGVLWSLGLLVAIGISYSDSRRSARLIDLCNYAALWVAFSAVGAIFTYVVATMRMPLCDTQLTRLDTLMGFDWTRAFHFVATHRVLRFAFAFAYQTMLPQILGSILFFAHTERTERNREFLAIAMLSLIATTLISGFAPAVGPYIPGHQPDFALVLLAIRSGAATVFSLNNMNGIITFPSFHTVIAVVLIYVHRPPAKSFPLIATLSGLMLLSVPTAGNHYLSDVVAGTAVAAGSIAAVRFAFRRAGFSTPTPQPWQSRADCAAR